MPGLVGARTPSVDAREKTTGRAQFISDLRRPGMLWGKCLRSPVAHASIRGVDPRNAWEVPGVADVLVPADCPDRKWGPIVQDQYILPVDGRIRFAGEEIAAVAAETPEAAREAADRIAVEYEELPVLLGMEEALAPDAPSLHGGGNLASRVEFSRGDMDAAWKQADIVVERTFTTPVVHQCYIEPVACLAEPGADGILTLWIPAHMPRGERQILAGALGIEADRIRIRQTHIGGSFGGKIHHKSYAIGALLALRTGKPVMMIDTREEAFQGAYPRVSMQAKIRLGVSRDGTFVAKEMDLLADNGAYSDEGPIVMSVAADAVDNLYRLENLHTVARLVYTNKVPSGAFRGFGNPQTTYAFECLVDEAAEALGWDPAELRLRNIVGPDCKTVHGWEITSCGLRESILEATRQAGWQEKRGAPNDDPRIRRGIGMACCIHKSGAKRHPDFEGASSIVRIDGTGTVEVLCGETELGQGARTVWAQIAAEVLDVSMDRVRVVHLDTDYSPYGVGTFASRVTTLGGKAVQLAAEDARTQLLRAAAVSLGIPEERVGTAAEEFYDTANAGSRIGFLELARQAECQSAGMPVLGRGVFLTRDVVYADENSYGNLSLTYAFATHVAEVEVDTGTGRVRVVRVTAAHDLGYPVNPLAAEGQIEGGVVMGVGWALHEKMVYDGKGILQNPNFLDYKIPTILDAPEVHSILIETNDARGPFGAKGLGEPAIIPVAPAVANAVAHAMGTRFGEIPITPVLLWEECLAGTQEETGGGSCE